MIDELRAARLAAGWSQATLAERVGVDPQAVKRLEKGVGSVSTLTAVMAALDFRLTGLGPGRTLHDQLRARRLRRSMSLDALAAATGLSRTTIASLEQGGGSVASLLRLMAVLAPGARRRARERTWWGEGDREDRDTRFTPPEFLAPIHAAFGAIDLDPCGHVLSPVVAGRRILLAEGGDGLAEDWEGGLAFVNPPFSELLVWLRRAHDQWRRGHVETVVCLPRPDRLRAVSRDPIGGCRHLPASRTRPVSRQPGEKAGHALFPDASDAGCDRGAEEPLCRTGNRHLACVQITPGVEGNRP